ncbi:MAG: transcription-repair coupling factor, partial [Candidatus Bathyarchaeia archaeon]
MMGYGGKLQYLSAELTKLRKRTAVVIVSQRVERLAEFFGDEGVEVNVVSGLARVPPRGSVMLVRGWLDAGWKLGDRLALLTDREIFGFVKQPRFFRKRPVRYHWFISELVPGDYVVHVEHGIGRFAGLARVSVDGIEREYLILEYAAGDRLYVPIEQVERVSRYVGGGVEPVLTRLGTQDWARTKQRVKESVWNMARELLELYARRELAPGFAFSRDTLWQQELEASFPYAETPDQAEAVNAVKRDMEKPKPMDRLICGDVGYGKTEVALRAAFKAVMDGKQVALLVPTTVLAQQHFNTFRERLQAFPVRVEMLSRFCTEKEQARVIAGLASGAVDICIGTHRLLQKDVVFKDLGLVIIDEEQRFGVVHKEHFKKLRQEVDVLTLSATPIPRTLHMALSGIRDMSIIETPPDERLPVRIHVGTYDRGLVRMAILREIARGGQVFYVHNRIHDIYSVARRLEELVPEAKILVAHGRMPEDELEEVMIRFVNREADVLVTTTIVESGLDMPNVNTLIVDRADLLGLSQLYQLRGRVGRGCDHAYAYFFYDAGKELTPEAWKRLKTIAEATELGAGFTVAMRDLEIRGAGNILGVEQSGYVAAVGFDLYCRMLAEAVEELRRGNAISSSAEIKEPSLPRVDLPLSAYIPEEYIPDLGTRLNFYRRLADAKCEGEVADIASEMADRFGDIPEPVKNLLYVVRVKQLAARAQVGSIFKMGRYIVVQFDKEKFVGVVSRPNRLAGFRWSNGQAKIDRRVSGNRWAEVLEEFLRSLVPKEGCKQCANSA